MWARSLGLGTVMGVRRVCAGKVWWRTGKLSVDRGGTAGVFDVLDECIGRGGMLVYVGVWVVGAGGASLGTYVMTKERANLLVAGILVQS